MDVGDAVRKRGALSRFPSLSPSTGLPPSAHITFQALAQLLRTFQAFCYTVCSLHMLNTLSYVCFAIYLFSFASIPLSGKSSSRKSFLVVPYAHTCDSGEAQFHSNRYVVWLTRHPGCARRAARPCVTAAASCAPKPATGATAMKWACLCSPALCAAKC